MLMALEPSRETPQEVRNDQRVVAAYLGVEDEEVAVVEAEVGV